MRTRDMTEGKPLGLILSIGIPLMLGNVFQQLYTVVDAAVVGQGLGVNALAALGAADWYNWLFLGAAGGFAQGFSIPIAQAFGAKDHNSLRRNAATAGLLAIVLGLCLTAIAILSVRPALTLLHTPEDICPISVRYLQILFSGIPVMLAYNLFAGILRALGDGQTPLIAMALASLVNVALDVLFVLGLHMGVGSAALATIIAQAFSACFCLLRLSKVDVLRLSRADFVPERARYVRLIRLGLPLCMQNVVIAMGGMIINAVVNRRGVTFLAGYTATNKLYGVLEMAAVSFGYAIAAYTGQNLGAKKLERIRRGVRTGAALCIGTALCVAAFMFLTGRFWLKLFIDSSSADAEAAMAVAWQYLSIMSAFLPILYLLHGYRSALQGMGNTLAPMVSGLAELTMRVSAALLLPARIGDPGVFCAEVLAWLGADVILIPAYYRMMRSLKRTVHETPI